MIFYSNKEAGVWVKIIAVLCALVTAFICVTPSFDIVLPAFEVLLQYRLHLSAVFVFSILFLLFNRLFVLLFFVSIRFLLHLWSVLGVFQPDAKQACQGKISTLRAMTFNIYHLNEDYDAILNSVQTADPDIVFMQEVKSGFYHSSHDKLSQSYPFHYLDLRKGVAQGGAFYSKYPIESAIRKRIEPYSSVIDVQIDVKGQRLSFVGLHAASPRTRQRIHNRNGFIQTLTPYVVGKMQQSDLFIIAGDFNSAPWHPVVKKLKNTASLDGMGFLDFVRIQGTWPSNLPSIAQLPIDHIYYSDKFVNSMYYKGLSAGSDHYSLYTDLEFCN